MLLHLLLLGLVAVWKTLFALGAVFPPPSLAHEPNITSIDTPAGTPWVYLANACYQDGVGAKASLPYLGASDRMVISDCGFDDIGPCQATVTLRARSRIASSCTVQIIGWIDENGFLHGIQPEVFVFTSEFTAFEYVLPRVVGPDTYTDPDFGFVIRAASTTIDGSVSGIELDLLQVTLE